MSSLGNGSPKLLELFKEIDCAHFNSVLSSIPRFNLVLGWNSRLRTAAGRFIPGSRKYPDLYPPKIEIASYLQEEEKSDELIYDTMAHEMIHFWLWLRRRPYGHTPEFIEKMKEMGVSRYNPVPRLKPFKYLYLCGNCQKSFPTRRRLGTLACAVCCKRFSNGKYDSRFKLVLSQNLTRSELSQSSEKNS